MIKPTKHIDIKSNRATTKKREQNRIGFCNHICMFIYLNVIQFDGVEYRWLIWWCVVYTLTHNLLIEVWVLRILISIVLCAWWCSISGISWIQGMTFKEWFIILCVNKITKSINKHWINEMYLIDSIQIVKNTHKRHMNKKKHRINFQSCMNQIYMLTHSNVVVVFFSVIHISLLYWTLICGIIKPKMSRYNQTITG